MTARMVLPDSGPTSVLQASHLLIEVLASARVVSTPSAMAPTPAAMMAAEIGPSGLSGVDGSGRDSARGVSWVVMALLLTDGRGLGDQRAERAGHPGEEEREHEQQHGGAPNPRVLDQRGAVVDD